MRHSTIKLTFDTYGHLPTQFQRLGGWSAAMSPRKASNGDGRRQHLGSTRAAFSAAVRTGNDTTRECDEENAAAEPKILQLATLPEETRQPKAPRVIHSANHSLVEQGAWSIKRLRRKQVVELHPWSGPETVASVPFEPQRVTATPWPSLGSTKA